MPRGIYLHKPLDPQIEEIRRKKIGESSKKLWQQEKYRRKIIEKLKGHPVSEETRKKISKKVKLKWKDSNFRKEMNEKFKGRPSPIKGKHHTEETKRKIGQANKGRRFSEEIRKQMSERQKRLWQNPEYRKRVREKIKNLWQNPEYRKHQVEIHRSKSPKGEKHPNWQGGKSFESYSSAWTPELKQSIRQRDNFTCQLCEKYPIFDIHHIDYDKKNCEPNNLITLCKKCHMKTNYKRDYWKNFLQQLAGGQT